MIEVSVFSSGVSYKDLDGESKCRVASYQQSCYWNWEFICIVVQLRGGGILLNCLKTCKCPSVVKSYDRGSLLRNSKIGLQFRAWL